MILYVNCDNNPVTWNKKQYLLNAARKTKYDVQEFQSNSHGEIEYILNIEPCTFYKGSKWSGMWEIDLLCDRPQAGADWRYADTVFLAGSAIPERLEPLRHKTEVMFQACEPTIHRRYEEVPAQYDFIHCGTTGLGWYSERERCISMLRDLEYTFFDYGKDKNIHDYSQTLSNAKIQFVRSMKTKVADGEIAQRFFECLAIGPVVTNYVPDLELLGLIEGEDYYSYKNDEEMVTKFDRLVRNPDHAKDMAQKGREKALEHHTYQNRLDQIYGHFIS